jgi:hypothetical protein
LNPYIVLAAVLACIGSYFFGIDTGVDRCQAAAKKTDEIVREVKEAAQQGAAAAIAANQPINRTIVQKATREIETNTVYRNCVNTAGQLLNINQALTGAGQPAGSGKLPAASAAK